nr:hypothetical protein [Spirosoma liriopis]
MVKHQNVWINDPAQVSILTLPNKVVGKQQELLSPVRPTTSVCFDRNSVQLTINGLKLKPVRMLILSLDCSFQRSEFKVGNDQIELAGGSVR